MPLNKDNSVERPGDIIEYVRQLLLEALHLKASDIHLEPYEQTFRIRFRLDGLLHTHRQMESSLAAPITTRLKVLSQLDIAERRLPQDGRFSLEITEGKTVDFRISTCPTRFGEKLVLRILEQKCLYALESLGLEPEQQTTLLNCLQLSQGLLIVTGPTGSGKTMTLYTALDHLNTPARHIITCEDPIEIHMPGITQVNINPKVNLDFARALRAFLRQDPDVIMIGEMRDFETADSAIKAAQTGHLVLSTLHTNNTVESLTRLLNMGIPVYHLSHSISLIVAQRLARRLCPKCREPREYPPEALYAAGFADLPTNPLYAPRGCLSCHHGYYGRIGLFEFLPITPIVRQLILQGAHLDALQAYTQQAGIPRLRQAALVKVSRGLTSLEEACRVTPA